MASKAKKKESIGYRVALGGVKGILKLLIIICIIVVMIFLAKQAYSIGHDVFNDHPIDSGTGRAVEVVITEEMSVMEIGELLNKKGLLDERPIVFWIQEFISENHNQILPGTYTLTTAMNVEEMLSVMAQRNVVEEGT